ncbi:MAG: ABC transporter permease [Betaproteobacteria bacterium]|nr:ABC transporter permease [Betaproteobacteria bacterium]
MPQSVVTSAGVPRVVVGAGADGSAQVKLSGPWNLAGLEKHLSDIAPLLAKQAGANRHWDLSGVSTLDHAGALLLWRAWGRKRAPRLTLKPEHETLFVTLAAARHEPLPGLPRDWRASTAAVGRKILALLEHLFAATVLLGHVVIDAMILVRHPGRIPWREISANIYRTGAQALGITALVGFLVGIVLSYLSAQQLKIFGADVYIVNLLGVSIVRELGPVLAAVLIAGRSGSAITAQLGVMRVTEEIDAMTVMGIPHTVRLILPKMVALAVTLPLIVLWTGALALLGGMIAANIELDISYHFFLSRLPDVVPISNLWLGLGKSVVFGILIALIACHFGLRIEPNTESLGAGTTESVVSAITMVIIVDAIFAVMFSHIGIFR